LICLIYRIISSCISLWDRSLFYIHYSWYCFCSCISLWDRSLFYIHYSWYCF